MGTHNHLLQLGDTVYLEIVALDPEAEAPDRRCTARWLWIARPNRERLQAALLRAG
jgi:Glyoxalase-like domain